MPDDSRAMDLIINRQDRQEAWLSDVDKRVDALEKLPVKMDLLTAAFNRLAALFAAFIIALVTYVITGGPS